MNWKKHSFNAQGIYEENKTINTMPFFRFCSKPKFLWCHVTLVSEHTANSDWTLRNACAVQVSLRVELIHVKETVEDRWSVREITSGISWVSSAGELVVRARIDSECILTCWHLSHGWRKQ